MHFLKRSPQRIAFFISGANDQRNLVQKERDKNENSFVDSLSIRR